MTVEITWPPTMGATNRKEGIMTRTTANPRRRRLRAAAITAAIVLALVAVKATAGSDQWVCEHVQGGHWTKIDAGLGNGDAYGQPAMVAGQPDFECSKG